MLHNVFLSMFHMQLPLLEKVLRPIAVFLFLAAVLRLFGKRELAQLNPFDLVVLLSLSNTVQNAIIGDDNSVSGGLVGAFSLLAINWAVARLLFRFPRLAGGLSGSETVLLRDGTLDRRAMQREALTEEDLLQAIHKNGFAGFHDVSLVQLDPDGAFFVQGNSPSEEQKQSAEILKRLDALQQELALLRGKQP